MKNTIKRKMDWEGLRVRSLHAISNGWAQLPAGTFFTVTGYSNGLQISSDPCSCCGIKVHITNVNILDVDLVNIPYNKERIEWNQKRVRVRREYNGTYIQNPNVPMPVYFK